MKFYGTVCWMLFSLFSSLLTSCQKDLDPVAITLSKAESCINLYPDSALKLLDSIPHPKELTGKLQADYALLMTQALDKCFKQIHSDSLIRLAVKYYAKDATRRLTRGKALFYYGRVMRELDRQEEALNYYLQAKSIYDETKEYKMLGLIHEEIGMINRKQKLYNSSMSDFKKAFSYYEWAKDPFCMIKSYQNMGRLYLLRNQWDSANYVLHRALDVASQESEKAEVAILQELGILYRSRGDLRKAEYFFLASIDKEADKSKLYLKYLSLGYLYYRMKDVDNARKYLTMSAQSDKLSTRRDAYRQLCELEKGENEYSTSILYYEKADSIRTLMEKQNSQSLVADLQRKYENEKLQNENLEIRMSYTIIVSLGAIAFFTVVVFMGYYYSKNKNHRRKIQEIEHTIRSNEEDITRYRTEIGKIQNTKEQLVEENRTKIGELNGKIMILNTQNGILSEQIKVLGGEIRTGIASEQYMPAFRLLLGLKDRNLKERLTNEEWEKLFALFDWLYNKYRIRLLASFPHLTKHDLELCCLLKIGFTNEELKCIFHTTSDSVTRAKTRLKNRLGMSAGDDLERYLRKF